MNTDAQLSEKTQNVRVYVSLHWFFSYINLNVGYITSISLTWRQIKFIL